MEWDNEDGHSVVDGKIATLSEGSAFSPGAKVVCKLQEGEYVATIVCTGIILYNTRYGSLYCFFCVYRNQD